jgi:hypothetical protein
MKSYWEKTYRKKDTHSREKDIWWRCRVWSDTSTSQGHQGLPATPETTWGQDRVVPGAFSKSRAFPHLDFGLLALEPWEKISEVLRLQFVGFYQAILGSFYEPEGADIAFLWPNIVPSSFMLKGFISDLEYSLESHLIWSWFPFIAFPLAHSCLWELG